MRAVAADASMRPARKGPENHASSAGGIRPDTGFNEAGPQGAGKPARISVCVKHPCLASMRPARKGPENPTARALATASVAPLQ